MWLNQLVEIVTEVSRTHSLSANISKNDKHLESININTNNISKRQMQFEIGRSSKKWLIR